MPKYKVLSHWDGKKQLWISHKSLEAPNASAARKKAQRDNKAWAARIKRYNGEKVLPPVVGKVRLLKGKK